MLLISILILQTVQAYPIFKPDKLQNVNILLNALDYLETQGNDTFTTLKAFWIQNPEYLNSLEQIGPLTIFAPTDAAYYKLPVNIWQDKNATFENLKCKLIF